MSRIVKIASVLAVACGAALAAWVFWACLEPTPKFPSSRTISVRKGESLNAIAHRLASADIVRSARATILYAELTGGGRNLKPGQYAFGGGENAIEVLRHLVNGDFLTVTVAIPEGATLRQIAEKLEQSGLVCQREFEEAARWGTIPGALGLAPLGTEGYLFPATYRFPPDARPAVIVGTMLERFYVALPSETNERLFAIGLSLPQMVTLASIIEKEAKVPGERPTIASVFYNRMRLGMPLQSDPTAQYNPDGEIEPAATAVHTASAYNTYSFAGLPPGPISNPGMSSIMAALYPAHTDYLYFVARKDGTHIFTRTLREHERAIDAVRKLNIARDALNTRPALDPPSVSAAGGRR
jgi:UPF0755 protein